MKIPLIMRKQYQGQLSASMLYILLCRTGFMAGSFFLEKIILGRLQVQVEQNLSSNYISGIHLIKKSVEQFIRSVVA